METHSYVYFDISKDHFGPMSEKVESMLEFSTQPHIEFDPDTEKWRVVIIP